MTKTLPLLAAVAMAAVAPTALAQDAAAGEKKAAMCIGCHGIPGYQASFPQVHRVPMISGQNAKYIVASLQAYKKGARRHPSMRGLAGSLTDADMADLGAFYEQHGGPAAPVAGPLTGSRCRKGARPGPAAVGWPRAGRDAPVAAQAPARRGPAGGCSAADLPAPPSAGSPAGRCRRR